jgi:hypothetical protein
VEVTRIDDNDVGDHDLEVSDIYLTECVPSLGMDEDEVERASCSLQRYLKDNPYETLAAMRRSGDTLDEGAMVRGSPVSICGCSGKQGESSSTSAGCAVM